MVAILQMSVFVISKELYYEVDIFICYRRVLFGLIKLLISENQILFQGIKTTILIM